MQAKEIKVIIEASHSDVDNKTGSYIMQSKSNEKFDFYNGISKTIAVNMISKGAQYVMSNYGNLTGDYMTQSNINSLIEIGSLAAMAATGPVGVAAAGISLAFKSIDYAIENHKKKQELEFFRERIGMSGRSRR